MVWTVLKWIAFSPGDSQSPGEYQKIFVLLFEVNFFFFIKIKLLV
jgi:hypothetical protein